MRVVRSEWTKLWSVRSTRWTLAAAFVFQAGLGPLIAAVSMARWNELSLSDKLSFDVIDRSLGGFHLAQLAVGVLGVMIITGEYSTGQIRSTFAAVPRRLPVLWAKLVVLGLVTLVLIAIAAAIGFFAAQAIFTEHHVQATLSTPHALRALIGTTLYMTASALLGTGLGALLRSTAGAISTFAALILVLPGIVDILPSSIASDVQPYLPSSAGADVAQAVTSGGPLSPWGGFGVFCAYVAVAIAAAAVLLLRRDA